MRHVVLRMDRYLSQGFCADSTDLDEIYVPATEGESVLDLLWSYAAKNETFRRAVFDEKSQRIQMSVMVIMNGRIVNPYNRSEATLKDGDEVMVLAMLDGG